MRKNCSWILSDGVNPVTGEILPEEDSCNQVEIVRALHTVLRYVEEQSRRRSGRLPENAGYTREEICHYFKRTTGAIAAKLVKLEKIEVRKEFRRR